MLSRGDQKQVTKREGLWKKAQPHWEAREEYEKDKKKQELLLKKLRREPETTDPGLKVSSTPILLLISILLRSSDHSYSVEVDLHLALE